jgi:uncharacterized protein (TIGR00255 family)
MIQSMTGYAAAAAESPKGRLSLELRSVNSRFLDLQFRIAEELRALEPMLRERIASRVARGKVDCRLFLNEAGGSHAPPALDPAVLAQLKALAEQARRSFPDAGTLRLADVLRWPGAIAPPQADDDALGAAVQALCDRALDELADVRRREGEKLAAVISARIAEMGSRLEAVAPLVPEAVAAYRRKLEERLREAMVSGNEERIRAEMALFASKVDIDEELERLRAHCSEVERTLRKGGIAGKRLDFLAQELNREANTLASKAASGAISDCALELKLLIEQVREQVQNIE